MTKFLRQSEYQFALNLARKERRRGDVIAADRWLKHADRQLVMAERFVASMDAAKLRDAELAAARARASAEHEELLQARSSLSLHRVIRKAVEST